MNALLGGIIGGALEKGGKAAYHSIAEDAELERKMQMENHRSKIEEDRAMRLEAIRGAREDKNYARQRTDTVADKKDERTFTLGRDQSQADLTATRDTALAAARAAESQLDREHRSAEAGASRAQSASQHAASLAAQKGAQGVMQTNEDGTISQIRDGKATQVVDAATGLPFKAQKGVSQTAIESAKVHLTEANDKDATPEARAAARQTALALLNPGAGPKKVEPPNATQIENLRKNASDPAAVQQFDARFGPGAGAAALKGGAPPAAAPAGAAPPARDKGIIGADPYKRMNETGTMTTEEAAAAKESAVAEKMAVAAKDLKSITPDVAERAGAGWAKAMLKKYGAAYLPEDLRDIIVKKAAE